MDILNIPYKKYKLENGLEIILYQDKSLPITAVNLWYNVGSSVEKRWKTGLAHLFEHMMFQGSLNIPKGMHFKYIQESGGTLNGSTSFDRTNYYEKVPSNFLEMALWLESDRMGYLLPSINQEKLSNQIDVVKNERLERYDNQPYGLAWEKLLSLLYQSDHPYSWPTIGWMKDILSYSLNDVTNFFKTYYQPKNAVLVIAGDIEYLTAKELAEKYFSTIPSTTEVKDIEYSQSIIDKDVLSSYEDNVQLERIYLAWHTDKIFSDDDSSLEILSDIFTGSKNGRFYKNLVFDKQLALDVSSFQFAGKYGGFFFIMATAKPGISLEIIKNEIFNEINSVVLKGITSEELLRSKNGIKSSFIYSLQNIDQLADQMNHYNFYLGEPNSFNFDLTRYENVSQSDVKNSAGKYLTKNYIELKIVPKKVTKN
jgi:zinc protease